MDLQTARRRVLNLLDDREGATHAPELDWTDVDDALRTGQAAALSIALEVGAPQLYSTATLTSDSTGLIDLSSLSPVDIGPVRDAHGNIPNVKGYRYKAQTAHQVQVQYVAPLTFPADIDDEFDWGNAQFASAFLDQLMVIFAAQELAPLEGKSFEAIDARRADVETRLRNSIGSRAFSMRSVKPHTPCTYGYVVFGSNALQLVLLDG